MFDVSFTELMVIGVVALVVIGPERLPRVARTAGHLLGKLQRYVSTVKADINREMHLEELKQFEQSIRSEVSSIGSSVQHEIREVETVASDAAATVNSAVAEVKAAGDVAPAAAASLDAIAPPSGDAAANGAVSPPLYFEEPVAASAPTPETKAS